MTTECLRIKFRGSNLAIAAGLSSGNASLGKVAFFMPNRISRVVQVLRSVRCPVHRNVAHPRHLCWYWRGPYPSGASVKNAGFACFGSPSELLADIEKEGLDMALARVEMRWEGLLNLRAELGDYQIGFEPTGGHEVYRTHDALYTRVLEKFDALNDSLLPSEPVYLECGWTRLWRIPT